MKRLALLVALLLPGFALWQAGLALPGYMLLALGQPALAAALLADPAEKGAALYAAGQWQAALAAFGPQPQQAYNRANTLARLGRYAEAMDAYETALDLEPDNEDARFNLALVKALAGSGTPEAGLTGTAGADSQAIEERQGHVLPASDGQTVGTGNGFAGSQEGVSARNSKGGGKIGKTGKDAGEGEASGDGQAKGSASSGGGAGKSGGMALDVATAMQNNNRKITRMMDHHAVQPTPEWLASLPDDPGKYLKLRLLAEQERRRGGAMPSGEDR